jgi:hypothetical protein
MKRICITMALTAIILAGCNSNGTVKETSEQKEEGDAIAAATLTDISSSADIKILLCQNWENKEDAADAELSGGGGSFEMPYRGFSFFTDLTMLQNPRDAMRFGKWNFDDANKQITIVYADGGRSQYKIAAIGAKEMILMSQTDKKKITYRADGKVQKNIADDPFYGVNNQWRKKPGKAETDEEIKKRVNDCVLFYSKFLNDNVARGGTTISFVGLPAIFKWYSGGISVLGKEKLENKWINCFYNKEQAYKAQTMLEAVITKKYKWNKKETNWVKQDADVVRQIYDTLMVK